MKAYFLDSNDIAVSKYIRAEPRDLKWIHVGIEHGILNLSTIEKRIGSAIALDGEIAAVRVLIEKDKQTYITQTSNTKKNTSILGR